MDLFFVLSGFLVSGLLFREHERFGSISIKHFLMRRGFKIYPAFWILMVVTLIVILWKQIGGGTQNGMENLPTTIPGNPLTLFYSICRELLFIQNYWPGIWNHTWSLAVEEHFYFLLVVLLFLLSIGKSSGHPFRLIPYIFLLLALVCLGLRIITALLIPYRHLTHLFPTHLRIDSLFFGVCISYFYHYYPSQLLTLGRRYRLLFMVAGVIFLAPAFIFKLESTPFIYTFGLTLFYLASGLLLISFLTIKLPNHRITRFLAYIGSHSYSIYLWHMPIIGGILLLKLLFPDLDNWVVYFFIYIMGSICGGIVMTILIEFPVLHLRDRLYPSRARAIKPT